MANPVSTTYFLNPFATIGDVHVIGDTSGGDAGTVNYPDGWTATYQIPVGSGGLPVPRNYMNQLFLDITSAIQLIQKQGFSNFVASADGGPTTYPTGAWVAYGGVVYIAQSPTGSVPGTDATWTAVVNNAQGIQPGTIIDFAGPLVPTGYLLCDGTNTYLRADYPNLVNAITQTQTGTTTASVNTLTGLSNTAAMYVGMALENANVAGGTTVASIVSSTEVTMSNTASASGAVSTQFFTYSNGDGSTTFAVPNAQRRTTIGSGGSGNNTPFGVAGNVTGQIGGQEGHIQLESEMAQHYHNGSSVPVYLAAGANGGGGGPILKQPATGSAYSNAISIATDPASPTVAANVMQPSLIVTKCIKY